jgi:hypothetical protein
MMYDEPDLQIVNNRGKHRFRSGISRMRWAEQDGFVCIHCRVFVSAEVVLAGVQNRNHCPYCLWSRHLDLHQAGDRLSACKGKMRPVGLTVKRSNKRYGNVPGELMIVHHCTECDRISANRFAADDVAENIYALYEHSLQVSLETEEVTLLNGEQRALVRARLFGSPSARLTNNLSGSIA